MTDRTPEQLIAELSKEFPPHAIAQREGSYGKMLDYVATETVIRRLNAVAVVWDFTIKEIRERGNILIVWGEMTIPGLGTRSGTGVQVMHERGGEDLIKGALSDAIKNAAKCFGVGIDLYGPDLEAGEIADTRQTPQNGSGRTQPAAPARRTGTSVNTVPVDPDDYDDPPADPGIVSWKAFWDEANTYGYKFKTPLEAAMKQSLGADPAYALERFQAWVKDTAQQKVLA